jgi:transposase
MRYVGIDVGSEEHVVAVVDGEGAVLLKALKFAEDAEGYARLREAIGDHSDVVVAMEATGHYWQNLFAFLTANGFHVAVINPLRTRRFAEEDLKRTKTDAIDALGIAQFCRQKKPAAMKIPDEATIELRELVRLREQLLDEQTARANQLHRLVDLIFPEFGRHVQDLRRPLATTLLSRYPSARHFAAERPKRLAELTYGGKRHKIGDELAQALISSAKRTVGAYQGEPFQRQIKYACEDLDVIRRRLKDVSTDVDALIQRHELGKLILTFDGLGSQTVARLIATFGDFTTYGSGAAMASYIGVVPGLRQSGKQTSNRARLTPIGNARLRRALFMPTLLAVRSNDWLRAFYERLVNSGKPKKLALIAAMRKMLLAIFSIAKNRKPFVLNASEVPACPA